MYGYRFCDPDKDPFGFAQAAAKLSAASTSPKFDPVKTDILEFASALTPLTDNLSNMHVNKALRVPTSPGAYISVDHCVALAFRSDINKAAQAQTASRGTPVSGGTRSQSPASEEYPAAYVATLTMTW